MGRHTEINQPAADMPEILPAVVARIEAAQDAALTSTEMDEVLAAGIDLGRLEALDFVVTVTSTAILQIYENVKKSKAWRLLKNTKSGHGAHFESLEEFCEVKLGKSHERLRKIVANRNAIGQDAFDQAERLGLHQRDYNAIKSLPAPDQELVRRAVEDATSREDVLDLLQELAARHAQVKRELTAEVEDSKKELAAIEQRLQVVNRQKEVAEQQASRIAVMSPDESLNDLQLKATHAINHTLVSVQGYLRQALFALSEHEGVTKQVHKQFMQGLVGQVQYELDRLRDEFFLEDTTKITPAWIRHDEEMRSTGHAITSETWNGQNS